MCALHVALTVLKIQCGNRWSQREGFAIDDGEKMLVSWCFTFPTMEYRSSDIKCCFGKIFAKITSFIACVKGFAATSSVAIYLRSTSLLKSPIMTIEPLADTSHVSALGDFQKVSFSPSKWPVCGVVKKWMLWSAEIVWFINRPSDSSTSLLTSRKPSHTAL